MILNRKGEIESASLAEVIFASWKLAGLVPPQSANLRDVLINLVKVHGRKAVVDVLSTYNASIYIEGQYEFQRK